MAITFVSQTMNNVNTALQAMGTNAGALVQADVRPLFISLSVLAIVLGGYAILMQRIRMSIAAGLGIAFRIAVVSVFVESWSSYADSFATLTDFPSQIGGIAASALGFSGGSIGSTLDGILNQLLSIATSMSQNGGYFSGALNGLIIAILGIFFAAIGVFVVITAQLTLAVMLIVGPVAIIATLSEKLAYLFTAWIKATTTAALIQMIAVIVIAVTTNAMTQAMPSNTQSVSSMQDVMGALFVGVVGIAFMMGVPGLAAHLAGGGIDLGRIAANAARYGSDVAKHGVVARLGGQKLVDAAGSKLSGSGARTGSAAAASVRNIATRLRGLN